MHHHHRGSGLVKSSIHNCKFGYITKMIKSDWRWAPCALRYSHDIFWLVSITTRICLCNSISKRKFIKSSFFGLHVAVFWFVRVVIMPPDIHCYICIIFIWKWIDLMKPRRKRNQTRLKNHTYCVYKLAYPLLQYYCQAVDVQLVNNIINTDVRN